MHQQDERDSPGAGVWREQVQPHRKAFPQSEDILWPRSGRDERVIREYIRQQEEVDAKLEQMRIWR